ncbi:protein YGR126W [Kluyveromyces marxianus]|nr:protein YGR126W [Kluyveromyces marxianus]
MQVLQEIIMASHSNSTSSPVSKVVTPRDVEEYVKENALIDDTESVTSLKASNIDLKKKAIPDFNQPAIDGAEFPEEYEVETRTGLVKVSTLHKLNRQDTRVTQHSSKKGIEKEHEPHGYNAEKLQKRIEQNQKEIDNYHNRSGFKKLLDKIFG